MGTPAFDVRCERREGGIVVFASGEIDLGSSEQLRDVLRGLEPAGTTIVLDLRGVTFIDSSGLSVIVAEHSRARDDGFRFGVAVGDGSAPRRLLELTGLAHTLELVGDPETLLDE